jgi:hypothetical protein
MSRLHAPMPYLVGVRLTHADREKLQALCRATHREQGDLIRLLIRLAQPTAESVLPLQFTEGEEGRNEKAWD